MGELPTPVRCHNTLNVEKGVACDRFNLSSRQTLYIGLTNAKDEVELGAGG